jgi:hypothetical protein
MYPLIQHNSFYVDNHVTYPPFKCGKYLEEYFLNYMKKYNKKYDLHGRRYIPSLWTNFQILGIHASDRENMQSSLDLFIKQNPCDKGYFTVVQHDDGPLLKLPENTVIYGACSGTIPIPLIYEDYTNTLLTIYSINKRAFNDKKLMSFVGRNTHPIRNQIYELYKNDNDMLLGNTINEAWSEQVTSNNQYTFLNYTVNSKFSFAPRGYGKSSFRFFEILLLGSIPIYVWDDVEWLPYKDIIDYSKFCISIHTSQLPNLKSTLETITEKQYNAMLSEYNKIKKVFTMEFMCQYITQPIQL